MATETEEDHHPFWHTLGFFTPILSLWFVYAHFARIREVQRRASIASNLVPGLALLLVIVAGAVSFIDLFVSGSDISPLSFLAPTILTGTMVWGQVNLNRYWEQRSDGGRLPARWGGGKIAFGVVGALIAVLVVIGTLPSTSSLTSVFDAGVVTPITIDTDTTASIEGFFEADAYSFVAVEDQRYMIETRIDLSGDPFEDALLTLWDINGSSMLEKSNAREGTSLARIG